MPLLDVALAYAITMLAVATVVTKIVEFIQWSLHSGPGILKALVGLAFRDRAKFFDQMMTEFTERELAKIVVRSSNVNVTQAKSIAASAVAQIRASMDDGTPLIHLSNADLIEKLKLTELGRQVAALGDQGQVVLDEISRRYAAVEKKFTEIFRTRARLVSTLIAFVLAVAFNIDSINILGSYINNPALAAAVAAKSDQAMADYTTQLNKIKADEDNADLLKQLSESQEEIQRDLKTLHAGVFPFGWSYYPYGSNPPKPWSRTDPDFKIQPWYMARNVLALWLLGILITAILAGLGSPFWFDVVRAITDLTRGKGPSPSPTSPTTPIPPVIPATASPEASAQLPQAK